MKLPASAGIFSPQADWRVRGQHDDLRDNRLRPNLRLEQERIGFGWVEAALAALAVGASKQVIKEL